MLDVMNKEAWVRFKTRGFDSKHNKKLLRIKKDFKGIFTFLNVLFLWICVPVLVMTGGNVYNRPRSALQKNLKRAGRIKKQQKKKQTSAKEGRFVDDLTTTAILRKTKTNPHANITLSGKKKRLLMKEIKKEQKQKQSMELDKQVEEKKETKTVTKQPKGKEKMELD